MPATVAAALELARRQGVPRLDAQLLLAQLLQRSRSWLLAHDDKVIEEAIGLRLTSAIEQLASGVPLAYVMGRWTFCGLELSVNPSVLVPRPETEALVEWATELLTAHRSHWPDPEVVDLGTGSGAIALAIQTRCPWAAVTATDISADALAVARANAIAHGFHLHLELGSWFGPLRGRRYALIVSNPPYIAGNDAHLSALVHEPRLALTPEGPGMSALSELAHRAPAHLHPGGWLLLEHGHDQAEPVAAALADAGFEQIQLRRDLAGLPRHTGARWQP